MPGLSEQTVHTLHI